MDVAVVGVGIAGAFALRSLSSSLEVVGIDKREKLGYPVECGEIIPTKEEMKVLLPELDDYSLFDIPKQFESNRTKEIHFVLPNGKVLEVGFEFHVVKRDDMIQKVAEKSGHKLMLKTRVKSLNNKEIETTAGKICADVIIASDGANSRIAKCLNVWKYELCAAKQYVMRNVECDEDVIYMFVGKKISAGAYAWIIPKGDGIANVGIGFRKKYAETGDNIHIALDRFIKEYPYSSCYLKNAEIVSKIGAVVPIDRPLERTIYDNVLLIGDAASMIISHVGGGIPISMVAGDLAGKIVNEHFENGLPLEKYEDLWRKYLYKPLINAYLIRRLWDRFSDDDERIVKILRLATNKDLGEILRCKIPLKVKVVSSIIPIIKKFL